jgi:hypothetical protein
MDESGINHGWSPPRYMHRSRPVSRGASLPAHPIMQGVKDHDRTARAIELQLPVPQQRCCRRLSSIQIRQKTGKPAVSCKIDYFTRRICLRLLNRLAILHGRLSSAALMVLTQASTNGV